MISPRKLIRALVLAAASAGPAAACGSALDIHTIRAPAAHFERYRTVVFDVRAAAPENFTVSPRSARVAGFVEETAGDVLRARGYVVAAAAPADLHVTIEAGRRERRISGPGASSIGTHEEASAVEMLHGELDREERDLVEGAFVIDVFDAPSRELLWHGSARTDVDRGAIDYERLRRAVVAVLASFPARTAP
jgi:hypothetical protein